MLFHFTTFTSAVEIISSHKLRFGDFAKTNDIAEVCRSVYSEYPDEVQKELSRYKFLSLIRSEDSTPGFANDSLWGYYAENGNGVCLAFDKQKLKHCYSKMVGKKARNRVIRYHSDFRNFHPIEINSTDQVSIEIERHSADLFYSKAKEWSHEREYRFVIKTNQDDLFLDYEDSLLYAIVCLPRVSIQHLDKHPRVLALGKLLGKQKVLIYGVSLGCKILLNLTLNEIWSENHNKTIDIKQLQDDSRKLYGLK